LLKTVHPWKSALGSVTASRAEASDPAEAVAEGQRRSDDIGRAPGGDFLFIKIPESEDHAEGESPLEDAAGPGQAEEFAGIFEIKRQAAEEQDELGADQRNDDRVKSGIHDSGSVEALFAGLNIEKPQTQSDADGQQKAVGVDGQRSDADEDGEHSGFLLR
jgi:hypothetical protein